jgi:hypothetical protein
MNRCAQLLAALSLGALVSAHAAQTATVVNPNPTPAVTATDGQSMTRNFPQNALRGKIVFGTPPAITMNGVATNMAMGYRIHGQNNLLVMSAQLVGSTATVDYSTDVEGHVYEVWILTGNEIAKLWPTTADQAAAWAFDAISQTWTKP